MSDYTKPKKIKGDNSKQKNITKKELDLKNKIYQEVRKSDKGTVGENIVSTYLRYFNIQYKLQYDVIINNHKHLFDFAIFKNKRVIAFIEYDGIQHFEAIDKYGGEEGLKLRQERDKEKDKYCIAENIKLLRIPHNKSNKVESIIKEEIIPVLNKTIRKKKIDTKKKKKEENFSRINCEQLSEILSYQVSVDLLSVWTVGRNLKNSNKALKTKVYSVIRRGKSFEVALKDKKYIISK